MPAGSFGGHFSLLKNPPIVGGFYYVIIYFFLAFFAVVFLAARAELAVRVVLATLLAFVVRVDFAVAFFAAA